MGKAKAPKFYAIKEGRKKNVIVGTWAECKQLTDKYPGVVYKSFHSREEAEDYLNGKKVEHQHRKIKNKESNKGKRISVYLSDAKIYDDMVKECERLDLTIDKAIEGLISEWLY